MVVGLHECDMFCKIHASLNNKVTLSPGYVHTTEAMKNSGKLKQQQIDISYFAFPQRYMLFGWEDR